MIIVFPVQGTTKSGREWLTQISIDDREEIIKQMSDNKEQLEYERSQLL